MTNLDAASPRARATFFFRAEDLLMAGWVALASPLLFRAGGDRGPFDPGQPVPGVLRLAAVLGVLVCLAARRRPDASGAAPASMVQRGVVGPFAGGLLLVTIAGFTALGAPSQLVLGVLLITAIAMVVVRFALPPLTTPVRRALVSPFVVIAGGLYWSFIESVIQPSDVASVRRAAIVDPHAAVPVLLFLAAFSIVYYAMLIYAPRQVAEREGGWIVWLLRYAAFVASIGLGIGWLSLLSG
jgi:hypothetical protein